MALDNIFGHDRIFSVAKKGILMINDITGPKDESVPILFPKVLRALKRIIPSRWHDKGGGAKILPRLTRVKAGKDKPLDRMYRFLGNRPFWGYNVLFLVVVFVLGINSVVAKNSIQQEILQSSSIYNIEEKAAFSANVGQYTKNIQEDPTSMVLASTMEDTSGYFSQPLITETKVTEQPEVKQETAQDDLKNRAHSITYIVDPGDTLSSIGWKYGLKVATIQYQNNIKGETITPGQKLILPPGDISSTVIARANQKIATLADSRVVSVSSTSSGWLKPINYTYISRRLGGGHTGIDFCAPIGTTVFASKGGVVEAASWGWNGGYGNYIMINHGGGVKSRYAHMSSLSVHAGQSVGAGQFIGASGNTGNSTGPHLHFEAIVGGRYTAPL